jgi:hypothetical protein
MQRRKVFISMAIMLSLVGVVLSGIILVNTIDAAAQEGPKPPLKVKLGLPSSVNFGEVFNISITVTNKSSNPVNINKIAVGYALPNLKYRGPYEVNFNPQNVPALETKSFTVPFKLADGAGTVVGLTVILANGAYTEDGVMGFTFGGVKVN